MFHRLPSFGLIISLLLSTPTPVVAKETLQLAPSSPWQINYSKDSCRLARVFGKDEQQILLTMDRFAPGEWFYMVISGNPVTLHTSSRLISVQFGPEEAEQRLDFKRGEQGLNVGEDEKPVTRPAILIASAMRLAPLTTAENTANKAALRKGDDSFEPSPISQDRKKAATYILFGKPLPAPLMIMTGSMAEPLAALQTCADELVSHWGVDVAALATQSREIRPIGSPGKWLDNYDYPIKMAMYGEEAIVHFRLSVGADGKPTACHIQQSTRPAEFDDAVCAGIMKSAQFEPALDAAGKPIASYYLNTVRFQMGGRTDLRGRDTTSN